MNRDVEFRFLEYAKQPQYLAKPLDFQLSEKAEETKPYRYVRTFSAEQKARTVSEMDKDQLQGYINQILGAKGLDSAIREGAPNQTKSGPTDGDQKASDLANNGRMALSPARLRKLHV